jgi:hypothetical protein
MRRSARVDLPWSIWAMMLKLRIGGIIAERAQRAWIFKSISNFLFYLF